MTNQTDKINLTQNTMTDIQQAIIDELTMRAKLAKELYICISATFFREHSQKPNELSVHISPAEGGAWKCIGLITINDDNTTAAIITVHGITRHTNQKETRTYYHCDPEYPQNLKDLIIKAAHNADKAFKISNNRSWARYRRGLR